MYFEVDQRLKLAIELLELKPNIFWMFWIKIVNGSHRPLVSIVGNKLYLITRTTPLELEIEVLRTLTRNCFSFSISRKNHVYK